ncbi:hypothetical protein [Streptomyces sp. NPDC003393]
MAIKEAARRGQRRIRVGCTYSWLALAALWLVYAMNANMRNFDFVVHPPIVKEFEVTPAHLGLFAGFLTFAQAVLVLPLSLWSDRGGHGWARKFRELPVACEIPRLYALSSDSSEKGAIAIGNGLQMVGQGIGGLSPILLGWLIERFGGFSSAQGFHHGLYFLAALQLIAAIVMTFFTRETIGVFKDRDRALVSRKACNLEAPTAA